jgi:hypothetical protein
MPSSSSGTEGNRACCERGLGRLIRDIRRKIEGQGKLEAAFEQPLSRATQIRSQEQRQRGYKLYSFHAPEVECIGKGKASAPYELMAWTTPALSGKLKPRQEKERNPCPAQTLSRSVSTSARTHSMWWDLISQVRSSYVKSIAG